MEKKIKGDFDFAIQQLLLELVAIKRGESQKSVNGILIDFDSNRGNDWYTDTLLGVERRELNKLAELKERYE